MGSLILVQATEIRAAGSLDSPALLRTEPVIDLSWVYHTAAFPSLVAGCSSLEYRIALCQLTL
jgi:hypothetical protein